MRWLIASGWIVVHHDMPKSPEGLVQEAGACSNVLDLLRILATFSFHGSTPLVWLDQVALEETVYRQSRGCTSGRMI